MNNYKFYAILFIIFILASVFIVVLDYFRAKKEVVRLTNIGYICDGVKFDIKYLFWADCFKYEIEIP